MSSVTGILLSFSLAEEDREDVFPCVDEINAWLKENHDRSPLHRIDESMCNGKHPQMIVFGGGYNHIKDVELVDFILSRNWQNPESVVLTVSFEQDNDLITYTPTAWLKEKGVIAPSHLCQNQTRKAWLPVKPI